jgi:diadenylate cyclase
MRIIAVYAGGARYVIEDSTTILSRAHQALATLERYKLRLDQVTGALSALEIEDLATVRDVTAVAQRIEMVRRIADEIEGHMVELGTDGRLLALQLDELIAGTGSERQLLVQDYVAGAPHERRPAAAAALAELENLSADELLDVGVVAAVLGMGGAESLDDPVSPHGYRLLATVPRLPVPAADGLISHFGGLQKLLAASVEDLQRVDGVGSAQAKGVREGLSRLAESSLLERYS